MTREQLVEKLNYVVKMARQYEAAVIRVPEAVHGADERLEQAKRELLASLSPPSDETLRGALEKWRCTSCDELFDMSREGCVSPTSAADDWPRNSRAFRKRPHRRATSDRRDNRSSREHRHEELEGDEETQDRHHDHEAVDALFVSH